VNSEPLLNVADYARTARSRLSKDVCDYSEGGALDESLRVGMDAPENGSRGCWVPDRLLG
jgi:hypothetical protein